MTRLADRAVKPRWWCITKECNHYSSLRCTHKAVQDLTGKKMIRVKTLHMCPVLASGEACLGLT